MKEVLDLRKNKLYNRIVKKYRKMLMKQVKQSTPFDYDGLYLFVTFLRYMLEYYVTKDNVHALEIEGHNRVEMLSKALKEFELWQDDDIYYNNDSIYSYDASSSISQEMIIEHEKEKEKH